MALTDPKAVHNLYTIPLTGTGLISALVRQVWPCQLCSSV
jgi:hypothetical protein